MRRSEYMKQFCEVFAEFVKESRTSKRGNKSKITLELCIEKITEALFYNKPWHTCTIKNPITDEIIITGDAIYRRFKRWCEKDIFKKARNKMTEIYLRYVDDGDNKQYFLDSTTIANANGTLFLGYNIKIKNKQSVNLNAVCDKNTMLIANCFSNSNIHDGQMLTKTIESSEFKLDGTYHKPTYIMADKAYSCKKTGEELKTNKNIIMVTPEREATEKKSTVEIENNKKELEKQFAIKKKFSETVTKNVAKNTKLIDKKKAELDKLTTKKTKLTEDKQTSRIEIQQINKEIKEQKKVVSDKRKEMVKIAKENKVKKAEIEAKLKAAKQRLNESKLVKKNKNNTIIVKKDKKKKRITNVKKEMFKQRCKIEHINSKIKRNYKRLSVISDRTKKILESWVDIFATVEIFKFMAIKHDKDFEEMSWFTDEFIGN